RGHYRADAPGRRVHDHLSQQVALHLRADRTDLFRVLLSLAADGQLDRKTCGRRPGAHLAGVAHPSNISPSWPLSTSTLSTGARSAMRIRGTARWPGRPARISASWGAGWPA